MTPYRRQAIKALGIMSRKVSAITAQDGLVVAPTFKESGLASRWQECSRVICEYFEKTRPRVKLRQLLGSDQMALAAAIGQHPERFRHLPVAYNYRAFNFHWGELTADEIKIIHQVAIRRYYQQLDSQAQRSLSKIVARYYDEFMLKTIREDPLPDKSTRENWVREARGRILDVIADFDIDDIGQFQSEDHALGNK